MNSNALNAMIAGLRQPSDLQMLESLREETEGKLQMLVSPRKDVLDSLFKEVRVFKEIITFLIQKHFKTVTVTVIWGN